MITTCLFNKEMYGGEATLIQDNARPHVAKATKAALAEMEVKVRNYDDNKRRT